MSNFSNARKLNAVYKDSLAVVNTNSNLDYYDEVNIGSSYRNTVDVSDIKIDTIPASPDFQNLFTNEVGLNDFSRFGININPGDETQKIYNSAYLDDSQTVIRFVRAELTPVRNSVDTNGGSYYCLDQSGKNLLENMIPYTAANSLGQLDDSYENTKLEYYDGTSYINIILQTNYHGNAILNHRQGLVTFNSNPSWSLVGGNSVPITTTGYKIYLTFYKYVGKKGIRVLNSTDVSGGLVVGGEYSGTTAPNDGAIIQGKVGIGTLSPDKKLHISDNSSLEGVKISHTNLSQHISIGWTGIVKNSTTSSGSFTLGLVNNNDLKFITNDTERMIIKRDGNVGIGTTTPSALLHVNSAILSTPITYAEDQDNPYLIAGTNDGWTGANTDWNTYGFQHKFKTNSGRIPRISIDDNLGERFTIKSGGNVGINNSDPQYKLDVNGNMRVNEGTLVLDKSSTGNTNEGGEIQLKSYDSGSQSGIWNIDSYQKYFRIFGHLSGNNALKISPDSVNGTYLMGINSSRVPTEALDVSGNIRIDNGKDGQNQQGGQLIFNSGWNKPGPNKIVLSTAGYGFGIDDSTLKYISFSGKHRWYYGGRINTNGTLGMSLEGKSLTVEEHITGGGDLTLLRMKLSRASTDKTSNNIFKFWQKSGYPILTFKGYYDTSDFDSTIRSESSQTNLQINLDDAYDVTNVKLSSTSNVPSYFLNNLAVGNNTTSYTLGVTGTLHATNNISTGANISATGTITQSSTSGTNTFNGETHFPFTTSTSGKVRVYKSLYSTKVVAGNPGMTASNERQLLVHNGSNDPGTMRINNFGLLEFTKHYSTGQDSDFGNTTTTTRGLAVADWKIEHGSKTYDSTYGDNLAFTFKRTLADLTTSRENTVLRLCPSSWEDEPRTNANGAPTPFESGLTYNAIFNGDVKINGNLVVDLNTTSRDTVVETNVYNAGIAIPSAQMLRLSDNTGASKIRFDKTSENTSVTYTDDLTANDNGKILLSEGARITVPATDTIGYHVFSSGSHRFYTSNSNNNELRLRIDNTNNVVIGSENSTNTSTLDYENETSNGANGRTPSLLNLWNSATNNLSETMIQFSNGNTTHPYRMGIKTGSDNINKFSVVTSDDTDIFTIDTENKKIGINNPNSTSHGKILDINGGIAVNYNDNTQFSYIGKLKLGKVHDEVTYAGISHIGAGSYCVAHQNNGTLLLNGKTNGIYFNFDKINRMRLQNDTFTIGGIGTDSANVNIVHAGTTQHTGNMTITGDLLVNTTNHNITMNDTNKIKLDDVTIDGGHVHIAPSNNITYFSVFNEPGLNNVQNTIIRAGTLSSNIIIGDMNTSGKIYIGHSNNSDVLSGADYFIQSKPIALSKTNNNSLYTQGDVTIAGNLNMVGTTKQIDINSGKLTIANATGDVVSQGNLSLNDVDGTQYFKIYDNASNEKFSVKYSSGNTIIKGTLNVNSQPFTVGGTIAGDETIQTPKFKVSIDGTTEIENTLTINGSNDGTGIQLNSGDLVIKNQNIEIRESDNTTVSFKVDDDGIITKGTWNAELISTIYGGLGANVSDNGVPGLILISQGNGKYLPKQISCDDGTINITANGGGINITSDVQSVTIDDFSIADSSTKGLMSADDKRAMEIIREFMFADNSISQTSDANKLHEGLVRKVKTYRTNTYYQFTSATMSKLFVGSFLYDINKPTANYSDYGMVGESFFLDVNSGDYTIPNDTSLLSTNFSQTTTNDYRVLFWQDYITTSDFGSIDIEFQCPYHEVDFSISNYKYNTVLYVQDYKFNPLFEPRAYNDMTSGSNGKILAEGRSQVKSDKGPRGQMFPLNGHFDYVSEGRVRIMVLVNTSQNDTDSNARLDIDARNAYLKVTELNDTNAT
jgi:hypothetical protein